MTAATGSTAPAAEATQPTIFKEALYDFTNWKNFLGVGKAV